MNSPLGGGGGLSWFPIEHSGAKGVIGGRQVTPHWSNVTRLDFSFAISLVVVTTFSPDRFSPSHPPSLFQETFREGSRKVYFSLLLPVLFLSHVEINFSLGPKKQAVLSFVVLLVQSCKFRIFSQLGRSGQNRTQMYLLVKVSFPASAVILC